jgi:chemotaxis protein methyltransferase CheR
VIDIITTNKTDFFREAAHFRFLKDEFLPSYQATTRSNNLNIWSAGCSTGEEPYTLVMVLEEYKKRHPEIAYRLLASDISIRAIQRAFQGIYEASRTETIPFDLKRQYFLRSQTDPKLVRVKPLYRKSIQYKRINLTEDHYGLLRHDFDIIFCRNVLIYFDKKKQEEVIRRFCDHLKPGGLLFLGHSESIMGMSVKLKQIRPTVYQAL